MSGNDGMASACVLGRRIAKGKADPVALVEQAYERLEAAGDQAIFVTLTRERALKEARAARKRAKAGCRLSPLDGVPMVWKDLTDMAGTVTSFGSPLYMKHEPAAADAPVIANAAAAGIVSLGKTNLSEFAFSGLGANPGFGTPRNPHDEDVHRLPGGSSSGSAVAVARGIVPMASGSDTAGSVRIPASWCGIVGYHGSLGRFDMTGNLPLSRHLDTLGVLARSVQDCAMLARIMRGRKPNIAREPRLDELSILVPANDVYDGVEDAVRANFADALKALRKAGARVTRRRIAAFAGVRALMAEHGHIGGAEAYYFHKAELAGKGRSMIDPFVARRIEAAAAMSAHSLLTILAQRERLVAQFASETKGFDLIAYPTTLTGAPELADAMEHFEAFMDHAGRSIRNTVLGNFLKLCGLALPTGSDEKGLPTSIAFAARRGEDSRLLAAGISLQGCIGGEAEMIPHR